VCVFFNHRFIHGLTLFFSFLLSYRKREAEGRKAGWTKDGVEEESGGDSSDDDSDEEDDNKKKPAAVAAPAPISAIAAKKKAAAAAPVEEPIAEAGKEGDAYASASGSGPAKLKAMDIKKMNGDVLKEHLKARNLDIQGQKKDLMKRLLDFEEARS
jgi:hypothetical protein